jgi:hypothetical protein
LKEVLHIFVSSRGLKVNFEKSFLVPINVDESNWQLNDRIGDQRGGSEWEPIKILLKNSTYAPNHFRRISHTLDKIM